MSEVVEQVAEVVEQATEVVEQPKKKRTRAPRKSVKYPEVPTSPSQIDGAYILEFFKDKKAKGEINNDDLTKWVKMYKDIQGQDEATAALFNQFRDQFYKGFFGEIVPAKKKNKKFIESLEDLLG